MPMVTWRGEMAHYSADEQAEMAELTTAVRAGDALQCEVELLHDIKALLGARIVPFFEPSTMAEADANEYAAAFTRPDEPGNDEAPTRRGRAGAVAAGQGSVFT